jgi:hypothetical protein
MRPHILFMKTATLQEYNILKQQGERLVYYVAIEEVEFLFRPLAFCEFQIATELERQVDSATVNDYIVSTTTLYSSQDLSVWLDVCKAIAPDSLSQAILNISGFGDPDVFISILAEKRELAKNMNSVIQKVICSAFPLYTPTQLEAMTLEEQVELLAKAEEMLEHQIDFSKVFTEDGQQLPPVPAGMESTEVNAIMRQENATQPAINEIGNRMVY